MKRGDRVRVPKGTNIHGTFPGYAKTAKRSYVVTIHDVDAGWPPDGRWSEGRGPSVCWVGTGGYWHNAFVADVEVLP